MGLLHVLRCVADEIEVALQQVHLLANLFHFRRVEQFRRLIECLLIKAVLSFAQLPELVNPAIPQQEVLQVDELTEAREGRDLEHSIDRVHILPDDRSLVVFTDVIDSSAAEGVRAVEEGVAVVDGADLGDDDDLARAAQHHVIVELGVALLNALRPVQICHFRLRQHPNLPLQN